LTAVRINIRNESRDIPFGTGIDALLL